MQSADRQPAASPETTPPAAPPAAPQHVVHHYYHPQKSVGTAVLLEILPGMFIQTFGIGHLYAGNVMTGLLFMFGYWLLAAINFLLCFVFIGFITWPICWAATMIISVILVSNSIKSTVTSAAPPQ